MGFITQIRIQIFLFSNVFDMYGKKIIVQSFFYKLLCNVPTILIKLVAPVNLCIVDRIQTLVINCCVYASPLIVFYNKKWVYSVS